MNYLTSFAVYLRRQEKSPGTIRNYTHAVAEYLSYRRQGQRYGRVAAALEPERLKEYVKYLVHAKRLRPSTINGRLSALSSFARYLVHRRLLPCNPVELVSRVGRDGQLRNDTQISWQAVQELRREVTKPYKSFRHLRNHVIIELLYTGMTVSELCSLKWDGRETHDHPGLRLEARNIELHPEAQAALNDYLIFRPSLNGSHLIAGKGPDSSLNPQAVYNLVSRLAKKTGTRIPIRDLRLTRFIHVLPTEERIAA